MKSRKISLIIVTVIFLIAASYLSFQIYSNGHEFKTHRTEQAKILDSKQRLTDWKEWIGNNFDLGSLFSSNKDKGEDSQTSAEYFYGEAVFYSYILAGISFIYFLFVLFLYRSTTLLCRQLAFALTIIAFVFLFIGISVPMMEIGFFTDMLNFPIEFDVPYINKHVDLTTKFQGRMYFFYQNKSIMDVIYLLFTHDNIIVATALLLFSVVNPLLKLILSLVLVFSPNNKNKVISFIVNNLGKWSMADVFVVSVFLSYLSIQNMSTGVESEVSTLVGLYFFMTFVVLSIISSMLLKYSIKKQKDTVIIN